MSVLGSAGFARALSAAGMDAAADPVRSDGSLTPQQAAQIPPESVQVLARQAAVSDPSVVEQAANFYAQHPTLVRTIGAGALALLMSRISAVRR
jgi:hypothetical protein